MISGKDPIIIVHLYNKGDVDTFSGGDASLLSTIGALIGFPIPIPLSETQTGIYVESETRAIDVVTSVTPVTTKNAAGEVESPEVSQTTIDSSVTVNLLAKSDSLVLTALFALMEIILTRLVTREYGITYLNKSTVIFNGLLNRFATSADPNTDVLKIELTLSNAKKESPTPKVGPTVIAKSATAVVP